jgi:hypothetical protein
MGSTQSNLPSEDRVICGGSIKVSAGSDTIVDHDGDDLEPEPVSNHPMTCLMEGDGSGIVPPRVNPTTAVIHAGFRLLRV